MSAREVLLAQRDELVQWIDEFRVRADADLAALLRQEMAGLLDEYRERKHRLGKLDFVDLLCCVRDLLRDQLDVRHYLQNRFSHLFIDEFQDTDPLQVEILMLLCANDPSESDWQKTRPKPESCLWWAIPSSRSTSSAGLTWCSTGSERRGWRSVESDL